jgi:predicted RNase H-related nuclease YkuK (DUF458 family)
MLEQMFHNPSIGDMSFDEVIATLISEMNGSSDQRFELLIGTDSSSSPHHLELVSAIVLHRVGRGGRYFWTRTRERRTSSLRLKIWREAWLSFELAQHVIARFESESLLPFNLEIHVDIGENGRTKELIDEVVGMIIGNGLAVRIKPHAYAASAVADKHT